MMFNKDIHFTKKIRGFCILAGLDTKVLWTEMQGFSGKGGHAKSPCKNPHETLLHPLDYKDT